MIFVESNIIPINLVDQSGSDAQNSRKSLQTDRKVRGVQKSSLRRLDTPEYLSGLLIPWASRRSTFERTVSGRVKSIATSGFSPSEKLSGASRFVESNR
jgi:hypothetical protein